MKVRTGFISNSSSSSFVIHVLQGSTEEQIRAMIEEHIGILDTCFLENFKEDMINVMLRCKGKKVDVQKRLEEEKNSKYRHQEWVDEWQDIIDKNLDVYHGGFETDGDPIEVLLSGSAFKIEEENFFIENNGEY